MREKFRETVFLCYASFYIMWTLGSFALVPVFWALWSCLTHLLDALNEVSLPSVWRGRWLLQSIMWFLFISVDHFAWLWFRYNWDDSTLNTAEESVVCTALIWYSMISLSALYTFPLALQVMASHLLYIALVDTNEALKKELERQSTDAEVLKEAPQHNELKGLRARYIHLHSLNQKLADAIGIPLINWTLNRVFALVLVTFYLLGPARTGSSTVFNSFICFTVECSVSLYLVGLLADSIAFQVTTILNFLLFIYEQRALKPYALYQYLFYILQAAAPKTLILYREPATEREKIHPEVEIQVRFGFDL